MQCATETDIKWPNDILVNDKKLCGILAETVETPLGRAVVVGIGINLKEEAFPPELREIATSVESATGEQHRLENVLRALCSALAKRYQTLQSPGGKAATIRAWLAASSYAEGKRIRVTNGSENFEGVTRGLEPDGSLRIETGAGEIKAVRAGDVTVVRPIEPADSLRSSIQEN